VLLSVPPGVVGVDVAGRRHAVHGPARASLADPAEAWPLLLDDTQVIHVTDDLRGWPLLLVPPAGTAEVTLYDTDRNEVRVPLDPSSRGWPVG
jgi:hypothetical protein